MSSVLLQARAFLESRAPDVIRALAFALQLPQVLTDLRDGMQDLITTSRFNRGGYEGPPLDAGRGMLVGSDPLVLHGGADFPVAIVVEVEATGRAEDYVYIGKGSATIRSSYRWPIRTGITMYAGNCARVIADRDQQLYIAADVHEDAGIGGGSSATGTVSVRIYKARL